MPASLRYIRAGKLRALAVTTAKRQEPLPDVPTVGEFLPGFEARDWYGIVVPKATPTEIVEKLNKEINAALADPNMKKRQTDLGAAVFAGSPADFGKFGDSVEHNEIADRADVAGAGDAHPGLPQLARVGLTLSRSTSFSAVMTRASGNPSGPVLSFAS